MLYDVRAMKSGVAKKSTVRQPPVRCKSKGRSALTNGKTLFVDRTDGRSREARRWRDLYRQFCDQAPGSNEQLCRSLATLIMQRELLDAAAARGDLIDPLHLVRITGAIHRTLAFLDDIQGEPEAVRKRRQREDREAGLI